MAKTTENARDAAELEKDDQEKEGTLTQKEIKEQKKKLRQEQKEQKKEAKKKARELSEQEEDLEDDSDGSTAPVFFITLLIVLIWMKNILNIM